jgi:hypothetical protein
MSKLLECRGSTKKERVASEEGDLLIDLKDKKAGRASQHSR